MKILVLGGSGFLGSHVCDTLTKDGHIVTIYDLKKSKWIKNNQKMIIGSILDSNKLKKIIKKNDIIYNFAALADLDQAVKNPIQSVKTNILGTALLLHICKKYKIKRFIQASSIYAGSSQGGFYSASKRASEDYIKEYKNLYGVDYTILRYGTVYGPRSDMSNGVKNIIVKAKRKMKISYSGSKRSIRQYIHVKDAAQASVKILNSKYKNKCIMLTGNHSIKVTKLLKILSKNLNIKKKIVFNKKEKYGHYTKKPIPYKITKTEKFKFFNMRNFSKEIKNLIKEQI